MVSVYTELGAPPDPYAEASSAAAVLQGLQSARPLFEPIGHRLIQNLADRRIAYDERQKLQQQRQQQQQQFAAAGGQQQQRQRQQQQRQRQRQQQHHHQQQQFAAAGGHVRASTLVDHNHGSGCAVADNSNIHHHQEEPRGEVIRLFSV